MATNKDWNLTLNTGAKIPAFGLGTWQSKKGEVAIAVEDALRKGYRLFDCAHIYMNEGEIGEAFQKCFKEGFVKREEIFVTSKLWNCDHSPEDVLPACQLTLKNLQLDYIDLYLIHGPTHFRKGATIPPKDGDNFGYTPESISQCWESMEKLVETGLCKAIGISNFTITKIENLLKTAKIIPAVNQVECHPYFQQQKLKKYCDSKGILIEAYSPLGNPSRPSKDSSDPIVMDDPVIKEIGDKYNATPAQICISFALHRGTVVIPKSVNPVRLTQNLESLKLTLSDEDMGRLTERDRNFRLFKGEFFLPKGMTWQEGWDVEEDEKFQL